MSLRQHERRPIQISRRGWLAMTGAALAASSSASAMDLRKLSPLAFQAHSMRIALARDFPGTLRVMRAMGFEAVELASFPGFVGNVRGDFTPLQQLTPSQIRRTVAAAGLKCSTCAFLSHEFEPDHIRRSVDWAKGVGATHMVYAGLELPARATLAELLAGIDDLNRAGERVRAAGLRMGFHSHDAMWRVFDGRSALDETMRRLDPALVSIQMDFGTVIQAGGDGAAALERYPDRFFSLHLRDAKPPADTFAYLPATPLGTGGFVDWPRVLRAAQAAGIHNYVVEMTRYPGGIFDAMKESYDFLRALKV